jgi:hypothetical protein
MNSLAIIAAIVLVILPHGPKSPHSSGDQMPGGGNTSQNASPSPQPATAPAPASLEYAMGTDASVTRDGQASTFIKNKVQSPNTWGSTLQAIPVADVRGKRVMVTGYIKTSDVARYAAYWVRVDGANNQVLTYDDMSDRPLSGTADWRAFSIVLDVPQNATTVSMGLLLNGAGEAWLAGLNVAIVTRDVPLTR